MIRLATTADLNEIVELHQQVLGYTINARIGKVFLHRLYKQIITQTKESFCMVVVDGNNIVGFMACTSDYFATQHHIRSHLHVKDYLRVFWFFCLHPQFIVMQWQQMRFPGVIGDLLHQPYLYILTLGISKTAQGKHYGSALIDWLKNYARTKGVTTILVDTLTSNTQALKFYQKNNFTFIKELGHTTVLKIPDLSPA